MKEDVLEVLLYLFENYMVEDPDTRPDQDLLSAELSSAGFGQGEIGKAFDWLEDLSLLCDETDEPLGSLNGGSSIGARFLSKAEESRLGTEGYGLLVLLESAGVLDPSTRELVIDRIMALDGDPVDLDHLRWVIMMVLCNRPVESHMASWVEELVLHDSTLH